MKFLLSEINRTRTGEKICTIQLRCMALNSDGILAMNFPKFGHFRLNGDRVTHQYFKIEDPPNDRKRKDKIMDLTEKLCKLAVLPEQNKLALELTNKVRTRSDQDTVYVAGLFIVKNIQQVELT